VESSGIVVDGRPVYMAHLVYSEGKYELWTVVNKNVKEQFTLFKESKKKINEWADMYSPIVSMMEDIEENKPNIAWTKKLGFKEVDRTDNIITMVFEKRG